MFRFRFPSFEKPDTDPRRLIVAESHDFRGVGTVMLLAASCGVALALWEPSHQVTTPFVTASTSRSVTASAGVSNAASRETTGAAAVDAEDDQSTPTVKLSTLCSQRTTARRDCANLKAFKDARLSAPDPVPAAASARASAPARATAPARAACTCTCSCYCSCSCTRTCTCTCTCSGYCTCSCYCSGWRRCSFHF